MSFSVQQNLEGIVGAKDAIVQITGDGVRAVAAVQGVNITVGQTVDRLTVLGTRANVPFGGYYMAQITFRRFMMLPTGNSDDAITKNRDLQSDSLPNPLKNVAITISTSGKSVTLSASSAVWNASAITIQAGTVLIMEDVTFECEDLTIS